MFTSVTRLERRARVWRGLLRPQLALYAEKFDEFQATLGKSNDIYVRFKKEMENVGGDTFTHVNAKVSVVVYCEMCRSSVLWNIIAGVWQLRYLIFFRCRTRWRMWRKRQTCGSRGLRTATRLSTTWWKRCVLKGFYLWQGEHQPGKMWKGKLSQTYFTQQFPSSG